MIDPVSDEPSADSPAGILPMGRREILIGVVVTCLVAILIPLATLVWEGADLAGRVTVDMVMPPALLWCILLAVTIGHFANGQRRMGSLFLLVWLFITLTFNGRIAERVFNAVERPPSAEIAAEKLPLRAVITLGGAAGENVYGQDEVNRDGERVISAAQMWHAGETRTIICTGMALNPKHSQTGASCRRILLSLGVPDDAIIQIGGVDTQSEMECLRELLDDPPPALDQPGEIGLITSAFHINRALRQAKKVSLDLVPIPVAYRMGKPAPLSPRHIVPTAEAGELFRAAMKERLAGILGK